MWIGGWSNAMNVGAMKVGAMNVGAMNTGLTAEALAMMWLEDS